MTIIIIIILIISISENYLTPFLRLTLDYNEGEMNLYNILIKS